MTVRNKQEAIGQIETAVSDALWHGLSIDEVRALFLAAITKAANR